MNHPQWCIKYVHKSKIHAVKIVNWSDHHEIATVPNVYSWTNGEDSEGKKAARMIAAAPELLDALKDCYAELNRLAFLSGDKLSSITLEKAKAAIELATP